MSDYPCKKTVLITGSGRGIGRAAALYFAGRQDISWNIVINSGHNPAQLEESAALIRRESGASCLALSADVGDYAQCSRHGPHRTVYRYGAPAVGRSFAHESAVCFKLLPSGRTGHGAEEIRQDH